MKVYKATLTSGGLLRLPKELGGLEARVTLTEYSAVINLHHIDAPSRGLSISAAWLKDVFPEGSTGRGSRNSATYRAVTVDLYPVQDSGDYFAYIERSPNYYYKNATASSRKKDGWR